MLGIHLGTKLFYCNVKQQVCLPNITELDSTHPPGFAVR